MTASLGMYSCKHGPLSKRMCDSEVDVGIPRTAQTQEEAALMCNHCGERLGPGRVVKVESSGKEGEPDACQHWPIVAATV